MNSASGRFQAGHRMGAVEEHGVGQRALGGFQFTPEENMFDQPVPVGTGEHEGIVGNAVQVDRKIPALKPVPAAHPAVQRGFKACFLQPVFIVRWVVLLLDEDVQRHAGAIEARRREPFRVVGEGLEAGALVRATARRDRDD